MLAIRNAKLAAVFVMCVCFAGLGPVYEQNEAEGQNPAVDDRKDAPVQKLALELKRNIAAGVLSAETFQQSQLAKPRVPQQSRPQGRGQENLVAFPLGNDSKADYRLTFEELYRQYFVIQRAYPNKRMDPDQRLKAYAQMKQMRPYSPQQRGQETGKQSPRRPGGIGPGTTKRPGPGQPGATDMAGCAWVSRGPTNINGRVTAISIDPNNNQRIFITTVGGIWRSLDGGRRWQRVSDDFLSTVFSSIAVNPADGTEIFAGGGDADYHGANGESGLGIWRSTTTGDLGSWAKVSPPELDNHVIYRLRIDPAAPNNVYAATSNGIYIGTRSGGTISFARLGGFDAWTNDMAIDVSATPRIVYAALRMGSATFAKGVWKHNGTSWVKRDSGLPLASMRTVAIALAQSSPSTLYLKAENGSTGQLLGVYKTTTGGETPVGGGNAWTALPNTSSINDSGNYSWYNSAIEVDPTNANIVWVAALGIHRSPDGGSTWQSDINDGTDPDYTLGVHADHHAIAFDPVNPKIVYVGNDGGVDRTTDTSLATWSWRDISHGMIITEFYRMATQWAPASILAGGSQDNGTEITYGNRTWHNPGGCDGSDVAVDAENASTLYANCNGGLYELTNPVPGTPGGGSTAPWTAPSGIGIIPPIVTDFATPGAALVAGRRAVPDVAGSPPTWDPIRLLKTTNGLNWTNASSELGMNQVISFIAIAPSASFQTYYIGVANATGATAPTIWRTTNGGGMWQTTASGVPNLWPTGAAIDYTNPSRAFASFGGTGGVAITTNGGANWTSLPGAGANALPSASVLGVAIDPSDSNVIFAATSIGVFRGVVSMSGATPTASWTPFNEGLPEGVDVNGVFANPDTGFLKIATFGHGMYERDINPGALCPTRFVYVRDNVFDRGYAPSPHDVPDPEHPIPDPSRPGFYKPDDSPGGRLFWWTSADIKVDVPSVDPAANTFATVDHVEFDACPSRISGCPPGTMIDSDPKRGGNAKVYVQVTNRGTQPASNVRVIALWTDATAGLPLLPNDFWTTTLPTGGGACGALDPSSPWKAADPANLCKTIPVVNPDVPEVTKFDWTVPISAAEHSCMLAIIESTEQPLDPSIRSSNERQLWVLVPDNRQIALRNLHVVDSTAPGGTSGGAGGMGVPNPTRSKEPIELLISTGGMYKGGRVIVILPRKAKNISPNWLRGLRPVDLPTTPEAKRLVGELDLNPGLTFEPTIADSALRLPVPPGETWKIGLVYDSGPGEPNTASRFSIVARQGSTVLGGSTYLLRILPRERF